MMYRTRFLSIPIIALMLSWPVAAAAQGGACLSDAEVQQAVASGQILPYADIVRALPGGDTALDFRVCGSGQQLYYEVTVRTESGSKTMHRVDARTGQL